MKILGIHGRSSMPHKPGNSWEARIKDLEQRWHTIDVPQLDPCEDPTYKSWENGLKQIDIESYDAIIAKSHGSWVLARYIKENDLRLKRVIFCCPGRWSHINTGKVYDFLESHEMNLEKHIDEIFIVHCKDDERIPYSEWVKFHNQVWWRLITLNSVWHKLDWEGVIIINNLATTWTQ
jgi:predicted alpha/beta hydrolase family esterase